MNAKDENGAESEAAVTWWLIAQLPPSKPESKFDLELLREVEGAELDEALAANALLARLASAAPYARLVELFQELDAARGRRASLARKAADMNRVARALAVLAASYGEEILRHTRLDFGAGPEVETLAAFVAEECERWPFRLLVAVAGLADGPFTAGDGDVVNDPAAIAALAAEIPEVDEAIDFVATFATAVLVAQRLLGRQLEVHGEQLDAATLTVRRLAAEVFDGAPGLMRAAVDIADGKLNIGSMTPELLHLDRALYLTRARRHAQRLLELDPASGGAAGVVGAASTGEVGCDDANSREAGGDKASAEGEVVPVPPGEEPPEPPPGGRADQVLDLRALADCVVELDALERVWSEGLAADALVAAQEEMSARMASLLYSVQRRVAASDRALRTAGVDPTVPTFPLAAEELVEITLAPNAERRLRQLQMAEVEALMMLLAALEAMRQPSAHEIKLGSGEVESWWEAGAFALVRARLRLLLRVSEEGGAAEGVFTGAPAPAPAPPFFDRLRLASDALSAGDIDGCLVQTALALNLRAALEGDAPDDLLARLAADERVGVERVLLPRLQEAAATLADGRPLELGAAVLLAPRLLMVVGRLCLETPELLREAVSGGADGGTDDAGT